MKNKEPKPARNAAHIAAGGKGEIIIYKSEKGPDIKVKIEAETVWLTQAQISELFDTERSVITKHLRNIFKSGELNEKSNVQSQLVPFWNILL